MGMPSHPAFFAELGDNHMAREEMAEVLQRQSGVLQSVYEVVGTMAILASEEKTKRRSFNELYGWGRGVVRHSRAANFCRGAGQAWRHSPHSQHPAKG
jgi:hypothetical protein